MDFENEDMILVDADGLLRAVLMDLSDCLMNLCVDAEVGEIKIKVTKDPESGKMIFKAKADGNNILEIKADISK